MAITTTKGSGVKKNNGGTVAYGGNVSSSGPITQALAFTTLNFRSGLAGSQIPSAETDDTIAAGTDTAGVYKPLSGGTYAFRMQPGKYLMRGYSTTISGTTNTVLQSGASCYARKSIMKIEQFRRTHESTWNWITGQPATVTTETDYAGQSGTTDHAARPSRSVPGELVILEGTTVPTYKDYSAKTG